MFGSKFLNLSGDVVVDDNYKNLSLLSKQSVYLGAGATHTFAVSGAVSPIMFLQCDGWAGIIATAISGDYFSWTVKAASATTVNAFVFDAMKPMGAGGFGMRIFGSNGVEVFNTGAGYLRVVDVFPMASTPMPQWQSPNPTISRSYGPGSYAVALGAPRLRGHPYNSGSYITDAINCSGSGITVASNLDTSLGAGHTGTMVAGSTFYGLTTNVSGL